MSVHARFWMLIGIWMGVGFPLLAFAVYWSEVDRNVWSGVAYARCARRMRFSSTRYATASCCWSDHQPATAITKSRTAATSTTAGVYISASGLASEASAKKWDTTGVWQGRHAFLTRGYRSRLVWRGHALKNAFAPLGGRHPITARETRVGFTVGVEMVRSLGRLNMTFEQHCASIPAVLRGEIRVTDLPAPGSTGSCLR